MSLKLFHIINTKEHTQHVMKTSDLDRVMLAFRNTDGSRNLAVLGILNTPLNRTLMDDGWWRLGCIVCRCADVNERREMTKTKIYNYTIWYPGPNWNQPNNDTIHSDICLLSTMMMTKMTISFVVMKKMKTELGLRLYYSKTYFEFEYKIGIWKRVTFS